MLFRSNRKLFQEAVGLVPFGFSSHARSTRLDILLGEFAETGPSVFTTNEFCHFVLTGVSGKYMVVLIAEYRNRRSLVSGT